MQVAAFELLDGLRYQAVPAVGGRNQVDGHVQASTAVMPVLAHMG